MTKNKCVEYQSVLHFDCKVVGLVPQTQYAPASEIEYKQDRYLVHCLKDSTVIDDLVRDDRNNI